MSSTDWLAAYHQLIGGLSVEQSNVVAALASSYGQVRVPLRVLAAAGAGKTLTMVAAVAYLVNEKIVTNPRDITVTTFTRKARIEVQQRLERVMAPGTVGGRTGVRVATYHAIAYSVVAAAQQGTPYLQRKHGWSSALNLDLKGRDRGQGRDGRPEKLPPGVTDEMVAAVRWVDLPDLWEKIALSGNIPGLREEIPSVRSKMKVVIDPKDLAREIDVLRSLGYTSAEHAQQHGALVPEGQKARFENGKLVAAARQPGKPDAIAYGWKLYEEVKKNLNAWDFADVLAAYAEHVAHGGDRCRLFIVDEAQDDSALQMHITRQVVHNHPQGRYCMVGDCKQSIYGFRGAQPGYLAEIDRTEGAVTLELRTNYRSGRKIVEAGNAVCEGQAWNIGSPAIAHRQDEGEVRYMRCESEIHRAERIACEIREAIQRGARPMDFAILSRTRAAMAPFEVMLLVHAVPARIQGGSPFFQTKPVRRIMAYVRLATGNAPESVLRDDFRRSLRDRGIIAKNAQFDDIWKNTGCERHPEEVFERLTRWYEDELTRRRNRELLWGKDELARRERETAFDEFLAALEVVSRNEGGPAEVVNAVAKNLARAGILALPEHLALTENQELEMGAGEERLHEENTAPLQLMSKPAEGDSDREMVAALSRVAGAPTIGSLARLAQLSLQATGLAAVVAEDGRSSPEQIDEAEGIDRNRVTVATVHAGKGLEWPFVYLLSGAEEIPYQGEDLPEERRIFYVGVTRARDVLVFATGGEESEYVDLTRPPDQRMDPAERARRAAARRRTRRVE